MEELGRIILAYSEVTEKLQQAHDQLSTQVQSLRQELGEKNRLLERKNRLAALGEMAAGMAHEIRNPLGGIQLYASLLSRDMQDRPHSLQIVQKISGGVKRLEGLVGQVLQFTREMRANAQPMDLAEIVEQAVELSAQARIGRGVRCEVLGMNPMPVQADPLLIGQTVLNLLLNAAEAMESPGVIRLKFSRPDADSEAKQFHLSVQDAGQGIPPGVMDKLFNPFFTTKDNGTGLGLAIVHRMVEAHDGSIRVTNPPDGGAKFEIRI
jgi:signal transduction histidine kinase